MKKKHAGRPPKPPRKPGAACERPRVKEIKALVRSPKAGAVLGSPVLLHVASALPRCAVNATITVDGKPYGYKTARKTQSGVRPRNPILLKELHLHGKALRRYEKSPSCSSAHSLYFQVDLPKGRHILRVSGCPQGRSAPATVPASVHFRVR